ncbi:hypothetical protein ACH4GM_31415 [Streptomyces coeruleorubidus]|uniref:hypothetical protein n=1 Tax=Streptomyces coeruleorubidus TaxID=116188 RepID=UPI003789E5D8
MFHATGYLAHVMDAIDVARRAAEATAGQGDHPRSLGILAVVLHKRFGVTGELQVLSEAVDRARESVRLGASLVAGQAQRLSNLGAMLSDLFTRTGEASVLDEAIDAHRAAADVTADDDPGRAVRLANLGGVLGMAYEKFGDRNALRDAIAARPWPRLRRTARTGPGTPRVWPSRSATGARIPSHPPPRDGSRRIRNSSPRRSAWPGVRCEGPSRTPIPGRVY